MHVLQDFPRRSAGKRTDGADLEKFAGFEKICEKMHQKVEISVDMAKKFPKKLLAKLQKMQKYGYLGGFSCFWRRENLTS